MSKNFDFHSAFGRGLAGDGPVETTQYHDDRLYVEHYLASAGGKRGWSELSSGATAMI
jgi:hypothetical protein